MSKNKCKLCNTEQELEKSHIIPRSYFKSLKSGNGQLVSILCDDTAIPKLSNTDPKERLLCKVCEDLLNVNYEGYGTQLFKKHRNVKKTKDFIEFSGFKYTDYYLFLVSILWRASISTLADFSNVKLGPEFEKIIGKCIHNKSLEIGAPLKIDHFIKISVLRVIDSSNRIDDDIIKKIMINFGMEHGKSALEGMIYYFMIDGFLITFFLSVGKNLQDIQTSKVFAQLLDLEKIRIPKAEITDLKQINDAFNIIINSASKK